MAGKKKPKPKGRAARKRRGKSEAMTGAKEGEVEVRTIGDNSQLAMPEPDVWNHHRKAIRGWEDKLETAKSGLRNAKKAAIKPGMNMESLGIVVKIERQNDPAKARQFFDQIDLGLSLSDESTLRITTHNTLEGDQEELVAERFYRDGKAGRSLSNPYPAGSSLALIADTNWKKGQAEIFGITASNGRGGLQESAH